MNNYETRACEIIAMGYEDDPMMKRKILDGTTRSGDVLRCVGAVSKFLDTAFHSTTNTAAREVMAKHDADAVRCNFSKCGCDYCAALRPTLTQQQGGEQEAGDVEQHARELLAAECERDGGLDAAKEIRAGYLTGHEKRAIRAISAALRSKQLAASDGGAVHIMRAAFVTADENYSGKRVAAVYADASMIGQQVHIIPAASIDNTSKQADGGAVADD